MTRLARAPTSSSAVFRLFSFSKDSRALVSLELVSLVTDSKLAMDVKRVSVSVFKDCIFFLMASMVQDCSAILVYEATRGDELNQVSKMEAWNQRASLDFDAQLPM